MLWSFAVMVFGILVLKRSPETLPGFSCPCWHVETCWNLVKWSLADEICHWYPYFTSIATDSRFDLVITSINGNPAEDVTLLHVGSPTFDPSPSHEATGNIRPNGCKEFGMPSPFGKDSELVVSTFRFLPSNMESLNDFLTYLTSLQSRRVMASCRQAKKSGFRWFP